MEYIWIWPICAMAAAVIAKHKGRSPVGWFCVGLLAGVFALLVAVLPSREAEAEREARMHGTAGDFRRCPVCAEAIRAAAQKCRYCQSEVGAIDWRTRPLYGTAADSPVVANRTLYILDDSGRITAWR